MSAMYAYVCLGGTNDVAHAISPYDTLSSLLSIHDHIRASNAITVAITIPGRAKEQAHAPPYVYVPSRDGAVSPLQLYARRMIINQGLTEYCDKHTQAQTQTHTTHQTRTRAQTQTQPHTTQQTRTQSHG